MGKSTEKVDSKGREKCLCKECNDKFYHRLDTHLRKFHKMSPEDYILKYPGSDVVSDAVKQKQSKKKTVVQETDYSSGDFKLGVASLKMREDLVEGDRAFVPLHDEDWVIDDKQKEDLEDLMVGVEDGQNVYIGGPTGCGKSAMVAELASFINQPIMRIQLKRDFKASEFVGKNELVIGDSGKQITKFMDGILPFCMLRGFWLLLDEYDNAHPDVHMSLQAVLEGKDLVLSEDYGRVIEKNPESEGVLKNFRIIATANTFGRGDDTGLYAGAKVQNEATMDRFGVVIKINYPESETEKKILAKKANISADKINKMVSIAQKVRKAQAEESCGCTFSTRRLISWARKTSRYEGDVRRAAKISVLNRLDPEDSTFVNGLIQRYFGGVL